MKSQRRRLEAETSSSGVGTQSIATLTFDETDVVNFHGMHYCFSIEPVNGDANANGWWVLYCLPAEIIQAADLPQSFADLDNEDFLPYVWGVGCWTASNQAPFHYEFQPTTSRNCQRGARVLGVINIEGVSAGNVRVNQTITGFT